MFEEVEYSFPVAEDTSVDDAVGMGPRPPFSRGQAFRRNDGYAKVSRRGDDGRGMCPRIREDNEGGGEGSVRG